MAPRIQTLGPPKMWFSEVLHSGRTVRIDRRSDGQVVISVSQGSVSRTTALPIKSFPIFGKPLAQRIREAVIRLDCCPPEEEPDEVEQAVEVALYHGGPTEESTHSTRREPPLVSRALPPPPIPPPTDQHGRDL